MTIAITSNGTNGQINGTNGHSGSEHQHERIWWKDAVIYQIYPSSYKDSNGDGMGDIPGIISKLDYLKDLGIDCIWLNPHYKSPQVDMGYDISDYQDIHEPYGSLEDCMDLIKGCHDRGIKIVFDLVVNHTSDQHKWFKESRSSKDNAKRDWYIWRKPKGFTEDGKPIPPCNWRAAFGGSVWEWDEATQEFYLHLFAVEQPDLNWELEEVRQAIYKEAILFWLERGVDGFRIDTVNMYSKRLEFESVPVKDESTPWQRADLLWSNGPRLKEFLGEMIEETFTKYNAVSIGEFPNSPDFNEVLPFVSAEAKLLSMVFQFEIANLDHGLAYRHLAKTWKLSEMKKYLEGYQRLVDGTDGWQTTYLENHDQSRSVSRYASDAPEFRVQSAKMLAIYMLTLTGTSFIYMGQEYGAINVPEDYPIEQMLDLETIGFLKEFHRVHGKDNEKMNKLAWDGIRLNSRDNGRFPIQWDDSEHGGFTTGTPWMMANPHYKTVNVASQLNDPKSVLSFYKDMLKFRKKFRDLMVYGSFKLLDMENEQTMVYIKGHKDTQAVIALNFTQEKVPFTLPSDLKGEAKLAVKTIPTSQDDTLEPYEGRVYLVNTE
ncbi:hypothetical protein NliqN6_2527 [Naganishia liquefaciens]|uniref:Glycosyl hydrolase family 13 catalytic domain-containing protein n=1 Tax=Naganishia liquefaciens TaxID=104408 RepID=A0A8H3YE37_9TREE|nr:hypothetical protein NliqN6_2527 [Naganishia liquefaciens]